MPDIPTRDPQKKFNQAELKSIQLAISWLEEYAAGYVYIERLRRAGEVEEDSALDRFFETALLVILDGLYPSSRSQGMLPVLRLVGCNKLANEIAAALDRKVGTSTYAAIANVLRDRAVAHPRFSRKAMMPIAESFQGHLQSQEDIDAFCESAHTVQNGTARVFYWFKECYPELVEHATSPPPDGPRDSRP